MSSPEGLTCDLSADRLNADKEMNAGHQRLRHRLGTNASQFALSTLTAGDYTAHNAQTTHKPQVYIARPDVSGIEVLVGEE